MEVTRHCGKCNGSGRISVYRHVADGICFRCGGTGKVDQRVTEGAIVEETDEEVARQCYIWAHENGNEWR